MKKILIIMLFSAVPFMAQSVYSQLGLGLIEQPSTVRNFGRGGTGITSLESDGINFQNPASLSTLDITRVEFSMCANGYFISSSTDKKYYSNALFNGFSFGFPVYKPYGIGFALGMTPFSTVRYEVKVADASYGSYTKDFTGTGGINRLYFMSSYNLPLDFRLGIGYNYLFGRSQYLSDIEFANTYSKAQYSSNVDVNGGGFSFGLISPNINTFLKASFLENLSAAFTYDIYSDLKTSSELVSISSFVEDTISVTNGFTTIPSKLVAGISAQLVNRLNITAEYSLQKFSSVKRFNAAIPYMRDYSRFSIGIGYRPLRDAFTEKVAYRVGFYTEQTPFLYKGTGINEFGFTAGITVPVGRINSVEAALSWGSRGNTDSGLLKENIIKLYASISLGDIWFIQQER